MAWTITYGASSVSLADGPEKTTNTITANTKEISVPGENMLLIFGKKAEQLVWDGTLAVGGKTAQTLINEYINVLKDFIYRQVTLSGTIGDDGTWVLTGVNRNLVKDSPYLVKYKLTFLNSATLIVVG